MSRRAMLALAAAITAFVLVSAGGVASYALQTSAARSMKGPDVIPVDVVRAREAEYRRLITEANARLREAAVTAAPVAEPAGVSTRVEPDDDDRGHERTIESARATTRTTMADLTKTSMLERWILAVVAIAATMCGWLAMAVRDAPDARLQVEIPSLPPVPTLEPILEAPPPPVRRPTPVATTHSSR